MAGSVVDGLLANVAGATVGVNKGKPKLGGTLTVGLISDVPNYHVFNGAQGKLDASGFCLANALYDPLSSSRQTGKQHCRCWRCRRRTTLITPLGPLSCAKVLLSLTATRLTQPLWSRTTTPRAADPTVGLAIQPIIAGITQVDAYTVTYNMAIPYSTFPVTLAEQQIAYMGHPSSFSSTYTGNPIGTGPFELKTWALNTESQFTKNKGYWRKDAAGRKLPYLSGINFKTLPDDAARNSALQTGGIDMILQQNGAQIAGLKRWKGITWRTDQHDPRDPSVNCLILNTTGTLNQYFCWAGEFASIVCPGALTYIEKGQAPPAAVQEADFIGTQGAVDPTTLTWNTKLTPVINNLSIRQACAMAINRSTYFKVIDKSVGAVADGVYRKSSPFYKNPHYPAYNPTKAKALVAAYKSANNLSEVGFVIDTVSGNSSATAAFAFFQSELAKVGIKVTNRLARAEHAHSGT